MITRETLKKETKRLAIQVLINVLIVAVCVWLVVRGMISVSEVASRDVPDAGDPCEEIAAELDLAQRELMACGEENGFLKSDIKAIETLCLEKE